MEIKEAEILVLKRMFGETNLDKYCVNYLVKNGSIQTTKLEEYSLGLLGSFIDIVENENGAHITLSIEDAIKSDEFKFIKGLEKARLREEKEELMYLVNKIDKSLEELKMKVTIDLDKNDIAKIIAEKYNCSVDDVKFDIVMECVEVGYGASERMVESVFKGIKVNNIELQGFKL